MTTPSEYRNEGSRKPDTRQRHAGEPPGNREQHGHPLEDHPAGEKATERNQGDAGHGPARMNEEPGHERPAGLKAFVLGLRRPREDN